MGGDSVVHLLNAAEGERERDGSEAAAIAANGTGGVEVDELIALFNQMAEVEKTAAEMRAAVRRLMGQARGEAVGAADGETASEAGSKAVGAADGKADGMADGEAGGETGGMADEPAVFLSPMATNSDCRVTISFFSRTMLAS